MSGKIDPFSTEWDGFCDKLCETLKNVGHGILDEAASTLDRDEGLRMLLRQLRNSTEREIEEHDLDFPVFAEAFTPTYHTLADAPDYAAYDALVDGNYDYRLSGQLGAADALNFTTIAPASAATATPAMGPVESPDWSPWSVPEAGVSGRRGREVTGMLDTEDLQADDAGNFEVIVSSRRPATGVWLAMSPVTDRIIVRNIYHSAYRDHRRYRPARLLLERIGHTEPPRTYSTDDLRAGLAGLIEAVSRVPLARADIVKRIRRSGVGRFSNGDSFWKSIGSNPRTHFQEGYWALGPDEAMLMDVDPPPAASFWSVGLTNFWMESLDFRFFPVNLNAHSVTYNADGGVRIVLAHRDPGAPNWLSTAGHAHGSVLWRWNDVEAIPALPHVQIVRFDGDDLLC
jgi:hypothetical protein